VRPVTCFDLHCIKRESVHKVCYPLASNMLTWARTSPPLPSPLRSHILAVESPELQRDIAPLTPDHCHSSCLLAQHGSCIADLQGVCATGFHLNDLWAVNLLTQRRAAARWGSRRR
jgi:hypothetical protein